MSWTWTGDKKKGFEDGCTKYVRGQLGGGPAAPDMYWDQAAGLWQQRSPATYDIRDEGLDRVDLGAFWVDCGHVYDQLVLQFSAIPTPIQGFAMWDPRRGQWMTIRHRVDPNPVPDPDAAHLAAIEAIRAAARRALDSRAIASNQFASLIELVKDW